MAAINILGWLRKGVGFVGSGSRVLFDDGKWKKISDDEGVLDVTVATTVTPPLGTYYNGTLGFGATITWNVARTSVDGYTISVGDTVLEKMYTTTNRYKNGKYIVTSSTVWTRDIDSDSPQDFDTQLITVAYGTSLAGTYWAQNTNMPVVGTDPIVYTQQSTGSTNVTQSTSGTQVLGQIPVWDSVARRLTKGVTQLFWSTVNLSLGIGGSPSAKTVVDVISTTRGSRPFPSLTSAQVSSVSNQNRVIGGGWWNNAKGTWQRWTGGNLETTHFDSYTVVSLIEGGVDPSGLSPSIGDKYILEWSVYVHPSWGTGLTSGCIVEYVDSNGDGTADSWFGYSPSFGARVKVSDGKEYWFNGSSWVRQYPIESQSTSEALNNALASSSNLFVTQSEIVVSDVKMMKPDGKRISTVLADGNQSFTSHGISIATHGISVDSAGVFDWIESGSNASIIGTVLITDSPSGSIAGIVSDNYILPSNVSDKTSAKVGFYLQFPYGWAVKFRTFVGIGNGIPSNSSSSWGIGAAMFTILYSDSEASIHCRVTDNVSVEDYDTGIFDDGKGGCHYLEIEVLSLGAGVNFIIDNHVVYTASTVFMTQPQLSQLKLFCITYSTQSGISAPTVIAAINVEHENLGTLTVGA